ncbi:MAG: hypothetical protein ACYC5K_04215 [Saccharofermentanales bacterium]
MDYRDLRKIHYMCFNGESGYIPLAVKAGGGSPSEYTLWDGMNNPQKTIDHFLSANENSMKIRSDWVPVIESNFLESLIPSLFGAQVYQSPGGLVDVRAFIDDISDTVKMQADDLMTGQTEDALLHLRYLREHPIENVKVLMSRFASPLDYAVMMRGGNFYLDMMTDPELAKEFMAKIADVTIRTIRLFKSEMKEADDTQVTIRGFHFPGIRLTGDAVVNLSPVMIRDFMYPLYSRFAEEFGSVMLHYCTSPAPAGHVLPALADCPGIRCVDNWHGYNTFFNKNREGILQDRISVCTDLSLDQLGDIHGLLTGDPFFSAVPRKGGRGIAATVVAEDIESGQDLFDRWTDYFASGRSAD